MSSLELNIIQLVLGRCSDSKLGISLKLEFKIALAHHISK